MTFSRSNNRCEHVKSHDDTWTCEFCGRSLSRKAALRQHLKTCPKNRDRVQGGCELRIAVSSVTAAAVTAGDVIGRDQLISGQTSTQAPLPHVTKIQPV